MPSQSPGLLFAQHGWADTAQTVCELATAIAAPGTLVIAPDLGYIRTWLTIDPLIATAAKQVHQAFTERPDSQAHVIGHSLGGLIWIELLTRNPGWLPRIATLTLLGSPVAGSDLARIFDPFGLGVSIAADLGRNRRCLAEALTRQVPTLVLAGDSDGGSDGTVPVAATEVSGATIIVLAGVHHQGLLTSSRVRSHINYFWTHGLCVAITDEVIRVFQGVPGMTCAHSRDAARSTIVIEFADGTAVRTWKNPAGVDHVFVINPRGHCMFGGFVGWVHAEGLRKTISRLRHELGSFIIE